MTSQAIAKNISDTLSKEREQQVTPVDEQKNQVDIGFALVKHNKNINKINLEDFPTPTCIMLSKDQEKDIIASNKLSCSRKVVLNESIATDSRTIAFNHMADKNKVANALSCTKVCRNIKKVHPDGKFGVCSRKYCTFAHSMDELRPASCSFDLSCRFKHGRIIDWASRTISPGSKCKFLHSDETINQYYARSGMTPPDLPPTSEYTRKIPEQPEKITEEKQVSRKEYDSDSSSSSESEEEEESSEEEEEEEEKRRLKKKHKVRKNKNSSSKNDIQVIRVPTQELAEIALNAAFDRGQFNIQVIIE